MAKAEETVEEMFRRFAEERAKALPYFPYERIEVSGGEAYTTWQRLKAERRGAPVVLGDDESVGRMTEWLAFSQGSTPAALDKSETLKRARATLALARRLRHPEDLRKMRAESAAAAEARWNEMLTENPDAPLPSMTIMNLDGTRRELTRDEFIALVDESGNRPEPIGSWPSEQPTPTPDDSGVTVAFKGRKPLDKVNIAIIPTEDWTEVPAYLGWGGWNECPAAEYHVIALRAWRNRYGAELVGLGPDVMNVHVGRAPATREEALDLAREQYVYCADIVDQGPGSLSVLAASLMDDPWWFFWWD